MNRRVVKSCLRTLVLVIICVFCATPVSANKIKVLAKDASVHTDRMPNGLNCYVVVNPAQKGMVDLALVQNTGKKTLSGLDERRLVNISREALGSQRRLLSESVQKFFTSHGASAGKDGFVKVTDDATIFHFHDVDISTHSAVLDSTLLVLMGIVDRITESEDTLLTGWFVPSDQAVIVCGDVDAGKVMERLRGLSFMTAQYESKPRREYVWKNAGGVSATIRESSSGLSGFRAEWRLARTPRQNMNTVQPLVLDMYMRELSFLAERRIKAALCSADIPYASVSCSYVLPANHLDDDAFAVETQVAMADASEAVRIVASALSSIAAGDISASEQGAAENLCFEKMLSNEKSFSNDRHVRICASAFLYNASLASEESKNDFLMTRHLPDSTELKIFKSIASASLDPHDNLSLTLSLRDAQMTTDSLKAIFHKGWSAPLTAPAGPSDAVSSGQTQVWKQDPSEVVKVKMKSSRKEYLSGGTFYTLSNGLKVVVKQAASDGIIHWAMILNGGFGHIPDLEIGEASYVSEFLDMCLLCGVKAESFKDAIRRDGITMDVDVSHSRTKLSGRIPDDGMADLMRVLLTVADTFTPDDREIDYRIRREPLVLAAASGTMQGRIAAIDSVMCPDYAYCTRKTGFDRDFILKAERFYRMLFSKMDDGMLVLVGDVDEKLLKQVMMKYAGEFPTSGRKSPRPVVNYQPISGTILLEREGDANEIDMVMSAPVLMTAENSCVAEIASMCLSNNVSRIVTGRGLHVRVRHNCDFYPQERLSMMLSLREASVDGFAPGTSHHEPMEALAAVRGLLKDLGSMELTQAELASCKVYLKQRMEQRRAEPEYWHDAISLRYIDGKDFTSGYEAKIDAITVEDVRNLLGLLSKGARVEYVINRK